MNRPFRLVTALLVSGMSACQCERAPAAKGPALYFGPAADSGMDENVNDDAGQQLADAGDGGAINAGTYDAGTYDAGTHDAGTHDAGEGIDDAGSPVDSGMMIDAGPAIDAGVGVDAGSEPDAGDDVDAGPVCNSKTQFIYLAALDESDFLAPNLLYNFSPQTLALTKIGKLSCLSLSETAYSMAVDREANIWLESSTGAIYKVNPSTAACSATTFRTDQSGFSNFGMGFSANSAGSWDETLFVSDDTGSQGLASVNTTSLMLTPIAAYSGLTGPGLTGRAELTGTGDGSLYGAFEGTPFVIAQIDKTTAAILNEAPQTAINAPPGESNFAFAAYAGAFWIFEGPGSSTDIYLYDPVAMTTTLQTTTSLEIVGAGVSTCAPME